MNDLKAAAEVTGTTMAAVVGLAEEVPMFGKAVTLLKKLSAVAETTKANQDACMSVQIWADSVKDALVNAAPALWGADLGEGVLRLFTSLTETLSVLLEMAESYQTKHYIIKFITSSKFKRQFDDTKSEATELLQAIQMVMQSIQLRLQAECSAQGATHSQGDHWLSVDSLNTMLKDNMTKTAGAMAVQVSVDGKLDDLIEQQHEMLQKQKHLEMQGQADVKLETLIGMIGDIDPSQAEKTFNFTISVTIGHHLKAGMEAVNSRRISTHAGVITDWSIAEKVLGPEDVLSTAEWDWLCAFVGSALDQDHGEIASVELAQLGPRLTLKLTPAVQQHLHQAVETLQLQARGVTLAFTGLAHSLLPDSAEFELSWPATGPLRSAAASRIQLPTVPCAAVTKPVMPDLTAMTGCACDDCRGTGRGGTGRALSGSEVQRQLEQRLRSQLAAPAAGAGGVTQGAAGASAPKPGGACQCCRLS